jgi:hypothetical protein
VIQRYLTVTMIPSEQLTAECATSARAVEPKQSDNVDEFASPNLSPGRFDFSLTSRLTRRLGAAVRQTLDGIADATATMVKEWDDMEDHHYSHEEEDEEEDIYMKLETFESLSSSDQAATKHTTTIGDGEVHSNSFLHSYLQKFELERSQHFVASCRKAYSKLPWEVWISKSKSAAAASDPNDECGTNTFGGAFVEHAALKEAILKLSDHETSFTEPILENNAMIFDDEGEEDDINMSGTPPSTINPLCILQRCTNHKKMGGDGDDEDSSTNFLLDCQATTQRLCQVDANLQLMHDKLVSSSTSTIVTEELFWRNYFYHCERLRIQLVVAAKEEKSTEEDDDDDDVSLVKIGSKDLEEIPIHPRVPRTMSEGSFVLVCDNESKVDMNQ